MPRECLINSFNKKKYDLETGSLKFQPGGDRGANPPKITENVAILINFGHFSDIEGASKKPPKIILEVSKSIFRK